MSRLGSKVVLQRLGLIFVGSLLVVSCARESSDQRSRSKAEVELELMTGDGMTAPTDSTSTTTTTTTTTTTSSPDGSGSVSEPVEVATASTDRDCAAESKACNLPHDYCYPLLGQGVKFFECALKYRENEIKCDQAFNQCLNDEYGEDPQRTCENGCLATYDQCEKDRFNRLIVCENLPDADACKRDNSYGSCWDPHNACMQQCKEPSVSEPLPLEGVQKTMNVEESTLP